MKEPLKRLKLIDHFRLELDISKNEFVNKFNANTDREKASLFKRMFEPLSSSKKEYIGRSSENGFQIRRRKRFFEITASLAVAVGSYRQKGQNLVIEVEVSSFSGIIKMFLIAVVFIYLLGFGWIATIGVLQEQMTFMVVVLPFILLHAVVMLGVPYLLMKRSTSRMKYDLERELHYIATHKKKY